MRPHIGYAKSGEDNIAYQVVGNGPVDLVLVMGWVSHIEAFWEEPRAARFLRQLASFSRLILFDKRGTGLSDAVPLDRLPTIEQRMDDVRAVMDAAGSQRAAVLGISEGAPMSAVFAATYPHRCSALIMYGGYAKRIRSADYPWAPTEAEREQLLHDIRERWGTPLSLARLAPSMVNDASFKEWWASWLRRGASPSAALALTRMNSQIDIRTVLPAIRVPTLILHRSGDIACPIGGARYMAEHIAGSKFVELPGVDHLAFIGDLDPVLAEIEQLLTGARRLVPEEPDRVLATVMVTELVNPGEAASRFGDERWSSLLRDHDQMVTDVCARHRARQVTRTLNGAMALFDGPARAVRCAQSIVEGDRQLGLRSRAGLHTGEVIERGTEVVGVAVHLAARVASHAPVGAILVSNTVRDLVAGSGLAFEVAGDRAFAGLPGEWRLYTVADRAAEPIADTASKEPDSPRLAVLTPREREVVAVLALGLSNRQIADELFISPATVERHVANILLKLGHRSRAQVAAWAVEHGLRPPVDEGS